MKDFHDKIDGPYTVTTDMNLYGMIAGETTVASGVTLWLYGMVTGDLRVQPSARVYLHGTVSGSVINAGEVDHHGVISGALRDVDGGSSVVRPDAVIENETH
jgi:cytoskeletal protein CcmA (bactofilin family)